MGKMIDKTNNTTRTRNTNKLIQNLKRRSISDGDLSSEKRINTTRLEESHRKRNTFVCDG